MTTYVDRELSQHWLRLWPVACWHQAIKWTNVDLSSVRFCGIITTSCLRHLLIQSTLLPQLSKCNLGTFSLQSYHVTNIYISYMYLFIYNRSNSANNTTRTVCKRIWILSKFYSGHDTHVYETHLPFNRSGCNGRVRFVFMTVLYITYIVIITHQAKCWLIHRIVSDLKYYCNWFQSKYFHIIVKEPLWIF